MSGRVFLDSNILVYTYSNTEPDKQKIARELVTDNNTCISTQVLQELCNVITRKFKVPYDIAADVIEECSRNSEVYLNNADTIVKACKIADKYGFSFYDSLIISSALDSGCSILYSEDMHHGQIIENGVQIINPFGVLK